MFFCMVSERSKPEKSHKKSIIHHHEGGNSKEGRGAKNEHLTPFIKLGTFYSALFQTRVFAFLFAQTMTNILSSFQFAAEILVFFLFCKNRLRSRH